MQPAHIGRYRIQRVLGSGGMGTVYEGVHETLGRRAAIKVLRAEYALDPDVARRFLDEARASSQVEHPGIVQVYEFGEDPPGLPYLVMEFLKGESLAERLAHVDRQRDLPKLLRCLQQVAEALAWAHQVGVIHRDIKPENVFIVEEPSFLDGERAKVVDFGLAKLGPQQRTADPTHTGVPMGTPLFMPPEQWLDAKRADDKSDAYSFGIMLYEVISGRLPFVAGDAAGLLERHLQDKPRSIRDWAPGLPLPLVELVHALLEKQREDRPTMKTVAATLLRVVSESPEALAHVWPPGLHGSEELPQRAFPLGDHVPTASEVDVFAKTLPQGPTKPLTRVPAGPNTASFAAVSMRKLKELALLVRRPASRELELPGPGFTPDELAQIESEYRRKLMLGDLRTVFGMLLFPILIITLFILII
ncbi:MAG: serine/threonine protein kinase [Myxococcales bacterium]|nr:serine/threonine protein kinase [Myxococcales bacterium]